MPRFSASQATLKVDGKEVTPGSAFEVQAEALEASVHAQCAEIVRDQVVGALREAGHSMGVSELSRRTELPRDSVRRALHDLMAEGRVWGVVDGQQALFAVETVGPCDWCGVVDHHLVAGECPRCRHKRH